VLKQRATVSCGAICGNEAEGHDEYKEQWTHPKANTGRTLEVSQKDVMKLEQLNWSPGKHVIFGR
jgi:hypothetical protein